MNIAPNVDAATEREGNAYDTQASRVLGSVSDLVQAGATGAGEGGGGMMSI